MTPTIALVLAGAVAKGAFEAGVLEVLAAANVRVARIVATSSGALNGVAYAAAVRAGREREVAADLVDLWTNHASWYDVFRPSARGLAQLRGISNHDKVRALLADHVRPVAVADPRPIDLRIVVAPVRGVAGTIGEDVATTHEAMLTFDGTAFDDERTLAPALDAAVASASFPGVFTPFDLPDLGPCIDGGTVNNTPIKYALEGEIGRSIDAIVVVAATVERIAVDATRTEGVLGATVEMLVNERLYRDLHDAEDINAALRRLSALGLDDETFARVTAALGWQDSRVVDIVRIRPETPLPGSPFSGFWNPDDRRTSIRIGGERARAVLGRLGWL